MVPVRNEAAATTLCVEVYGVVQSGVGLRENEDVDMLKDFKYVLSFPSPQGAFIVEEGLCVPGTYPEASSKREGERVSLVRPLGGVPLCGWWVFVWYAMPMSGLSGCVALQLWCLCWSDMSGGWCVLWVESAG